MGTIIAIVIVVVVVLAIAAFAVMQRRRTSQLRDRFGPEYDRAVEEFGGRRTAEPVLLAREKRVKKLDIQSLPEEDREQYAQQWRDIQARFVDHPSTAVADADRLVAVVMEARG